MIFPTWQHPFEGTNIVKIGNDNPNGYKYEKFTFFLPIFLILKVFLTNVEFI